MAPPCKRKSSLALRVLAGLGLVLLATWPSRQSSRTGHRAFSSLTVPPDVELKSKDAAETREVLPRSESEDAAVGEVLPTPAEQSEDAADTPEGGRPRAQDRSRRLRRRRRPRVRITHVGQRLYGTVLNVGHVRSGGALVNVGRHRPCLLLPMDWNGTKVEVGQGLEVFVKQIVWKDDHVLLSLVKPKRDVFSLRVGEPLRGTVTHVDRGFGGIFLDVGARKDGMLLAGQLTQEFNESLSEQIKPGMELDVFVKDIRQKDCTFSLTMFRPRKPIEELEVGQELQGVIRTKPSFGGAFVDVGTERDGWLSDREIAASPLWQLEEGNKVRVWVQEITREKGLQLTLQKPKRKLDTFRVGNEVSGEITGINKFGGVFVDVGGIRDGLVHAADLAGAVGLEVGSNVTAWVKQRKFESSLQLTLKRPTKKWLDLSRRGQKVQGQVTGFNNIGGVFIDIGWVNDALLRSDEIAEEVLSGPGEEGLHVGQSVEAWIKNAWVADGRIDLTMKDPTSTPVMRRGIV